MSNLSSMQPKGGEIVLHCWHARETEDLRRTFKVGTHWFKVSGPFVAPDGSRGTASWLVACDPCYQAVGNDPKRIDEIEVRNHVIWNGDAPVIVENYS